MKQLIYAAGIAGALLTMQLPLVSVQAAPASVSSATIAPKLNVNTATAQELVDINGIGEKKAQAIVTYRKAHGNFKTLEGLTNVHGISEKLLNKIRDGLKVK